MEYALEDLQINGLKVHTPFPARSQNGPLPPLDLLNIHEKVFDSFFSAPYAYWHDKNKK